MFDEDWCLMMINVWRWLMFDDDNDDWWWWLMFDDDWCLMMIDVWWLMFNVWWWWLMLDDDWWLMFDDGWNLMMTDVWWWLMMVIDDYDDDAEMFDEFDDDDDDDDDQWWWMMLDVVDSNTNSKFTSTKHFSLPLVCFGEAKRSIWGARLSPEAKKNKNDMIYMDHTPSTHWKRCNENIPLYTQYISMKHLHSKLIL